MWNFSLRRITSLAILSCILVATFVTIFSHFHGYRMPLFKSDAISSGIIQLVQKPLTFESASYAAKNEDAIMMELLSPSPPDVYPTPRRSRRGTPDDTFGTVFQLLFCQYF